MPERDNYSNYRLAVAPMLDRTDRHFRYFLRMLSPHARLYTEMITTGALLHGPRAHLLRHDRSEHPLALQLGGSDVPDLQRCARLALDAGYDEINLNVGCPSDRVQSGRFGACLMAEPALVADCIAGMRAVVSIPVTVKTRLGIDDRDSYEALAEFVGTVAQAGCGVFILHARKAWLTGLSPAQNRNIPPLRPALVYQLKRDFAQLTIVINGGIRTPADALDHLRHCDGVMIGREICDRPAALVAFERALFDPAHRELAVAEVVNRMCDYIDREQRCGTAMRHITRHLSGLLHGQPGARQWRRHLGENAGRDDLGSRILRDALRAALPEDPAGDQLAAVTTAGNASVMQTPL